MRFFGILTFLSLSLITSSCRLFEKSENQLKEVSIVDSDKRLYQIKYSASGLWLFKGRFLLSSCQLEEEQETCNPQHERIIPEGDFRKDFLALVQLTAAERFPNRSKVQIETEADRVFERFKSSAKGNDVRSIKGGAIHTLFAPFGMELLAILSIQSQHKAFEHAVPDGFTCQESIRTKDANKTSAALLLRYIVRCTREQPEMECNYNFYERSFTDKFTTEIIRPLAEPEQIIHQHFGEIESGKVTYESLIANIDGRNDIRKFIWEDLTHKCNANAQQIALEPDVELSAETVSFSGKPLHLENFKDTCSFALARKNEPDSSIQSVMLNCGKCVVRTSAGDPTQIHLFVLQGLSQSHSKALASIPLKGNRLELTSVLEPAISLLAAHSSECSDKP